jgi:hypothetical protein
LVVSPHCIITPPIATKITFPKKKTEVTYITEPAFCLFLNADYLILWLKIGIFETFDTTEQTFLKTI